MKKLQTETVQIAVKIVPVKTWKKFQALCLLEESDASSKIRLYLKRCVDEGKLL